MNTKSYENVDAANFDIPVPTKRVAKKPPCEVVPSKPSKERVYDTSHASIGSVIIFNQMEFDNELPERDGSPEDVLALREVLATMGFHVTSYDDKTVAEINSLIEEGKRDHLALSS